MKTSILLLVSVIGLTSCGGGQTGGHGTPGKSAYEIWLEQGNTGTEQDFLDSLVSSGNTSAPTEVTTRNFNKEMELNDFVEYGDSNGGHSYKYTKTTKPWAKHGGLTEYKGSYRNATGTTISFLYKEKELKLANYGITIYDTPYSGISGYMTNRDIDYGANAYIPEKNTVFKGSTLAYIYKPFKGTTDEKKMTSIKGDATFVFDQTSPSLILDFDNYYTIDIEFSKVYTESKNPAAYGITSSNGSAEISNVIVSGANDTGVADYDLQTGEHTSRITFRSQHFKQNSTEEAVGKYDIHGHQLGGTGDEFYITGAFGGTK